MDIASISSTFLSKLVGQGASHCATPEAAEPKTATESLSGGGKAQQARDILAQYDIRNITPREFSELAKKLHQAGVITSGEFQELSQLRLDLDLSKVSPDESINLLDFVMAKLRDQQDQLEELQLREPDSPQAKDPDAFLGIAQRQFDWVRKFADIQSGVASPALDKLA